MDFSLSTLGCPLPSSFSGVARKRQQLAPPATETLPQQPFCGGSPTSASASASASPSASSSSSSNGSPSCCSSKTVRDSEDSFPRKEAPHRDSLLVYLQRSFSFSCNKVLSDDEFDDDATASTLLSCTESSDADTDSESEGDDLNLGLSLNLNLNLKMVSFPEQLVTAVYTRPRTTAADKHYLHYNEHDYLDFKIGFCTGRDRTRRVSFAREVVSDTQTIPSSAEASPQTKAKLYYSEPELQTFLDEFVQSLQQRSSLY